MKNRGRILCVDDDPMNIDILQHMLEEDYDVFVARSGAEAIDKLDCSPDVILLDIMMPEMDGYQTCRKIRENPRARHCKVILVSAKNQVADRLRGYESGADAYITKPFDHEELRAKVKVFLRLKTAEELEELKGNLLTYISHGTRTPLTGILAPTEIILSDDIQSVQQCKEWARVIHENATQLHRMVEKGILLGQYKAGLIGVFPRLLDVRELVEEALSSKQVIVDDRGLKIVQDYSAETIFADARTMRIVVESLIDNAIRFSPEKGTVTVSSETVGNQSFLRITDQGRGIVEEELEEVFGGLFAPQSVIGGKRRGLSLTLSRTLVEIQGGRLGATSQPDVATTFEVCLPIETPVVSQEPVPESSSV